MIEGVNWMLKPIIFAPLLLGAIATPAFAQDEPSPTSFSGPRVEALAGYDEGLVYGIGVGYDLRAGGVVIGFDGEATLSTSKECASSIFAPGDRLCARQGRDLFGGLRIGVPIGDKVLVYAKGGYSNIRLRTDYEDGTPGGLNDFDVGANLDGGRIAGGLELSLGSKAFIKGEYRYSNYEAGVTKHDGLAGIGIRF